MRERRERDADEQPNARLFAAGSVGRSVCLWLCMFACLCLWRVTSRVVLRLSLNPYTLPPLPLCLSFLLFLFLPLCFSSSSSSHVPLFIMSIFIGSSSLSPTIPVFIHFCLFYITLSLSYVLFSLWLPKGPVLFSGRRGSLDRHLGSRLRRREGPTQTGPWPRCSLNACT